MYWADISKACVHVNYILDKTLKWSYNTTGKRKLEIKEDTTCKLYSANNHFSYWYYGMERERGCCGATL